MIEAQKLFDDTLADTAHLLASVDHHKNDPDNLVVQTHKYAFQVWQNGILREQSANAPQEPISNFTGGFQDNNFKGYRWRTYTLYDKDNERWIMMAERADIRYALAENVILESVVPILYSLPLGGLMIWFFVGRGLSPLRNLAEQLGNKRADDLSPLRTENQPSELTQVVSSTNDLLHRLKASFESEKRFTADAAHELRTPISALRVHLHNLSREIKTDDGNNIQQLNIAVERMGHLVEQMLQLHRTSPDQYMAKFQDIDLFEMTRKVVIQEYSHCEEKQQHMELSGEKCFISGDDFAIEIMIENLIGNAIKYTPVDGQIHVSVRCLSDKVELQIEDSGPGIPEEQYERIFDRFYRLDGDRHKSNVVGCGLGLAIVEHIVKIHDASISMDKSSFSSGLSVKIQFSSASST
jgi:two-component system sensor histidine kinase QseC